jgi:hypothetical protein
MGFVLNADPDRKFVPTYHTVMTGTEIVLTVSEQSAPVLTIRFPSAQESSDHHLLRLKEYLIAGLESIV